MAPNTAVCFCLVGISLCMLSRSPIHKWYLIVVSICASVVTGIGTISVTGYVSGIEATYQWGHLTQMSAEAATIMIILGVSLLATTWANKIDAPNVMPGWIALPFAMMFLTITLILWQALYDDLQISHNLPTTVLICGLLLTALLTWGVWLAQRLQVSTIELRQATRLAIETQNALDASSMITIADVQGNITYANENTCRMSQYSREELLGHNHRIIKSGLHPKEYYADIWKTIAHGKIWKGEFCNKAKDGTLYWAYATLFPFLGEDGKPKSYMGIHHDITSRKRLEADLQTSNRALEEFDHVVAHELKAPMTIIKMAADNLASAGLGHLNPEQ